LPAGATYQKTYLRALRRLLGHCETLGLVHPEQYTISPEWHAILKLIKPLTSDLPPHRRSSLRRGLKHLAKWATASAINPEDIPINLEGERIMGGFYDSFDPNSDSAFYQARKAWNMIAEAHSDLNLQVWEKESINRCRGISPALWPPSLRSGLRLVFEKDPFAVWSPATKEGYQNALANYLGLLSDCEMDCIPILSQVDDGLDALRLLYQGMPPGFEQPNAQSLIQSLAGDPEYRASLLAAMRSLEGVYEGRASEPNPLVMAAAQAMVDLGKITSAHNLYVKAMALNRGVLGLSDRHANWCKRGRATLAQLSRRSPAGYTLKKRVCFRHPRLWEALVIARSRLRDHTRSLDEAYRSALGEKAELFRGQWAVSLRNEVFFGLMLCYPLRARNYAQMQLGRHYDPASHRIFFATHETKNDKEIDYELPDGGSLGDLRELVETYLTQARPVLLADRKSTYFFVPNRLGGTQIPVRGFNIILAAISRRFLSDVLPPGLEILNPHMLRHIIATYHLAIRKDVNTASQLLNDSPFTIHRSYADVLENKKESTRCFLSELSI
jgi:integrase